MKTLYLVPASGRSYSKPELAAADWEAGKDFKIVDGPYCSIRDLDLIQEMGYTEVWLRVLPQGWVEVWYLWS